MTRPLNSLKKYVKDTLGLTLAVRNWEHENTLPLMIREKYDFYVSVILDNEFLLMLPAFETELTPAAVGKHIKMVDEAWRGEIILVPEYIASYNRKRLIEHKVPFIVPGNQMYLPMLGVDLREHFKKTRINTVKVSPATQVAVLHALNEKKYGPHTPSSMAKELEYSIMTMTRVFDELENTGIGEITVEGRERILRFASEGKPLWEKAREFMINPVKKRDIYVDTDNDALKDYPKAGLTGLSEYTTLSAPDLQVYALSSKEFNAAKLNILPVAEEGAAMIEIWRYSPARFARNGVIDKFSLYLSLFGGMDISVEMALEEMMDKIK